MNKRLRCADYFMIAAGTGCVALGIQWLYAPIGLVTGGFSGIAIIVNAVSRDALEGGIPLWLTNLALNVPVFAAAYKVMGGSFVKRTGVATVLLSFWLYALPELDLTQQDPMLASIFGGVISGIGIGFVLLARATTGGTDLVAALIQKKLRHYSVVQIMQALDGAVVLSGLFVFGINVGLYAVIAIFITSKVSDAWMEGLKFSKAALVITDCYEQVAQAVMETLGRGVTGLYAKGMYSGEDKCILYCVVSKKEIVYLKEIAVNIDPDAFVIVSDAREVLGEGFTWHPKT